MPHSTIRERIKIRARELALAAGRDSAIVSQVDLDNAEREITGEPDFDAQDALLNALPESKRWDPVPASGGRQVPDVPNEDEDEEGRNESAQVVEKGVDAAARDHMRQADQAADDAKRGDR